jgi:hypothetical protein
MYITNAEPSEEQVEYMSGLGFELMKSTEDSSRVTWVLPIGNPHGNVDGQDHAITIELYKSEIPKVEKLLVMIGKKAYSFGWESKLNQIKMALDIHTYGSSVDM